MTIPWMMNCSHDGDGWCLACVREIAEENEKLTLANKALQKENDELKAKADVRHCTVDENGNLRDIGPGGFSF